MGLLMRLLIGLLLEAPHGAPYEDPHIVDTPYDAPYGTPHMVPSYRGS